MTQQVTHDNIPANCKDVTIITLNINGLFDDKKKENIFQYLQNQPAQIITRNPLTSQTIQKCEKE